MTILRQAMGDYNDIKVEYRNIVDKYNLKQAKNGKNRPNIMFYNMS